MGKVHIIFILISSLFIANAQGLENLLGGREKLVKIRVYLQDILTGPNATVYEIARANITPDSSTFFSELRVIDNLMTAEPNADSKKLGRAQGHVAFTDMAEMAVTMCMNFVFTAGKYSGSTLSIVGRNQLLDSVRELPVVGGTGIFRWARGYTISTSYFTDPLMQHNILEYVFYVLYREVGPELLANE